MEQIFRSVGISKVTKSLAVTQNKMKQFHIIKKNEHSTLIHYIPMHFTQTMARFS